MHSIYRVQYGESPATIAEKKTGDWRRSAELVKANPHKAAVIVDGILTFRDLAVGENLTIPENWPCCASCAKHKSSGGCSSKNRGSLGEAPISDEEHKDSLFAPLMVGAAALLAGFGLAYVVTRPPKTISQITREEARRFRRF